MRQARLAALLLAVLIATIAFATSPPPPLKRVPPIGWETRITPGFDPPIEYYVVYGGAQSGQPAPTRQEVVKAWGPKAFDVLKTLSEDPAWAQYRGDILMCLQDADSPEKALLFAADAERLLADPEAGKNGADLHNALARLARADYPAFVKLLDAHLPSASEDLRRTLLGILAYQLRGDHAAECESKLNEIATASTNEAIKKMISDCIAENNARKRAQEPMATAPAPGKEAAR